MRTSLDYEESSDQGRRWECQDSPAGGRSQDPSAGDRRAKIRQQEVGKQGFPQAQRYRGSGY